MGPCSGWTDAGRDSITSALDQRGNPHCLPRASVLCDEFLSCLHPTASPWFKQWHGAVNTREVRCDHEESNALDGVHGCVSTRRMADSASHDFCGSVEWRAGVREHTKQVVLVRQLSSQSLPQPALRLASAALPNFPFHRVHCHSFCFFLSVPLPSLPVDTLDSLALAGGPRPHRHQPTSSASLPIHTPS